MPDPIDELFRDWRRDERLTAVDRRLHPEVYPMPDAWWAAMLEQGPPEDADEVDWEGLRSE